MGDTQLVCANPGPLTDLAFFDVDIIQHCTLHVVNLTLLAICNGSCLLLGGKLSQMLTIFC